MNLRFPGIDQEFDCEDYSHINALVIENPKMLFAVLSDVMVQLQGNEGKTVISDNNKVLAIEKYLELHMSFVPFNVNQKNLINKIVGKMSENAVDSQHYLRSSELLSNLERYFMELCFDLVGNIAFPKLSIDNIIKASGPEIVDDYVLLSEKLIDYFELVREYDRNKIFILLNLRSFLSFEELESFTQEVLKRQFQIMLLDSRDYPVLKNEKRYLVDDSLCEIC